MSQEPPEQNRAPKETKISIENMLLHPWRYRVQLFLDVEKHKMDSVAS